jgi:hypothetical protein
VKSSTKAWIAGGLVLALSISFKVLASPAWSGATKPTPRSEVLRRFLTDATHGGLEEIAAPANSSDGAGWRFLSGACPTAAFPSGPRGSLDMFARSHARKNDRISYIYRGELRSTPPVEALAVDVIIHRLTTTFRPTNEPGYVVLIYPRDCAPPSDLPWGRLPTG